MEKVLLAEDDTIMVSLLKTLLKMEGYQVVSVDADADVPAAARAEHPSVLLLDVHLSRQDGLAILDQLRADDATKALNVVMTSGLNLREECLRRGATDFLLKPYMPDDLMNTLKKVIHPA
ncbi:MAG: response regulator [Chloroflexota bacterium]|jgi:CheY-like chemotaxis protein